MNEGEERHELEYVGFWRRVGATIIDTLLLLCITMPLLLAVYGKKYFLMTGIIVGTADFIISWVIPAIIVLVFWMRVGATPGKMAMSARIVDAETGGELTLPQSLVRYLGYFASIIPFFVGFIWVAFDAKKRGWHDLIAGTVVVRPKRQEPAAVRFEKVTGKVRPDDRQEPRI